jgi:hypothetical protein
VPDESDSPGSSSVGPDASDPAAGPKHRAELGPRRPHRRVTTQPIAGTDPSPQAEPPRHAENENDDRLRADKPPHWG